MQIPVTDSGSSWGILPRSLKGLRSRAYLRSLDKGVYGCIQVGMKQAMSILELYLLFSMEATHKLSYNVCLILKRLSKAFILRHQTPVFVKAQIMEKHSNIIWHGMVEALLLIETHTWPLTSQSPKMPKSASNSSYVTEWKVCYIASVLYWMRHFQQFRPFQYSTLVEQSTNS